MPDWTYCNSRLICRINYGTFANHCKTIFICRKIIVIFPVLSALVKADFHSLLLNRLCQKNILRSDLCSALNSNVFHECHKHLCCCLFGINWGQDNVSPRTCEMPGNPLACAGRWVSTEPTDRGRPWDPARQHFALQSCAQRALQDLGQNPVFLFFVSLKLRKHRPQTSIGVLSIWELLKD